MLHAEVLYFQQRLIISFSWECFGKIEIARIKPFLEKRLGVGSSSCCIAGVRVYRQGHNKGTMAFFSGFRPTTVRLRRLLRRADTRKRRNHRHSEIERDVCQKV